MQILREVRAEISMSFPTLICKGVDVSFLLEDGIMVLTRTEILFYESADCY